MANVLKEKSFDFAVSIVQLSKDLQIKNEFILSRQVLRSGTAIGALVRESQNVESTKDFIHKLSIAQKECDETLYRLELLEKTDYIKNEEFDHLYKNCTEILKILKKHHFNVKAKIKFIINHS